MSTSMTNINDYEFFSRLPGHLLKVSNPEWPYKALCPSHDDNEPSLSIGIDENKGGRLKLNCHANHGCTAGSILTALGLHLPDLYPRRADKTTKGGRNGSTAEKEIDRIYDYTDATGQLLYQVVRYKNPKDFKQRRPKEHGKPGWVWGIKNSDKVPYRLTEIVASGKSDDPPPVFVVEGERDVESLVALGQVATTNAGGAGNWSSVLNPHFKGRQVVILPDNDDPGRNHAKKVATELEGIAASIRILQLEQHEPLPKGGDVSDWLVSGGTLGRLRELVAATPDWVTTDRLLPVFDEGRTDLAAARRLIALHGQNIRYCWSWKQWLIWDGKRWQADNSGGIMRLSKESAIHTWQKTSHHPLSDENSKLFALKLANQRNLDAAINLARSESTIPIQPDELDQDLWLLNCPNGTVDLKTGSLRPHSPADKITKLCPTSFDSNAWCPAWADALDLIFDGNRELIEFLQRFLGYCLTGDVREQLMVIAWGGGSNGKTTVLNAFLETLGPDYGITMDKRTLISGNDGHGTELMDLCGVRFASSSETEEREKLKEAHVKALTGGDSIRGRRLYQDSWEFRPTHKIILATNHLPSIEGSDHAIWRRIATLPFTQKFWDPSKGETGPDHLRANPTLKNDLLLERSGILNWCVQGCLEWQQKGLAVPDEIRLATEQFRKDQDLIGKFLDENCSIASGFNVRANELFRCFREWCEENGEREMSQTAFGKRIVEKGFDKFRSGGIWYRGLCVSKDHTIDLEQLE